MSGSDQLKRHVRVALRRGFAYLDLDRKESEDFDCLTHEERVRYATHRKNGNSHDRSVEKAKVRPIRLEDYGA